MNANLPITALIIDQSGRIFQKISSSLADSEHNLICCQNGTQALTMVDQQVIDVIFNDLYIPDMNTYDFLLRLRHSNLFNAIPVVMVTALSDPKLHQEILTFGVHAVIVEPIDTFEIQNFFDNLANTKVKYKMVRMRKLNGHFRTEVEKPFSADEMNNREEMRI
jgi:response regulator RpfG family c-di-GMP phosphodiesterase